MAIFGLVLLDIVRTVCRKRLALVDDAVLHVVVELDTHADGNAVGFHIAVAVVVLGLVRVAEERHLEVGVGVLVHQAHTARVLLEHVDDCRMDIVREHRVERLVFHLVNLDRLDMAGQRGRRKAVAARQKARNEGHRDKKQESGHIPRKHDANLKTNAQGEGGIKKNTPRRECF